MKGEGLLGKFSRAVSTDEDAIFKVFQKINSQAEYDAVANAYRKKYGADLYSAIKGELSPKEEFKGPDGQVMGTAQTLIFDKIDNIEKYIEKFSKFENNKFIINLKNENEI